MAKKINLSNLISIIKEEIQATKAPLMKNGRPPNIPPTRWAVMMNRPLRQWPGRNDQERAETKKQWIAKSQKSWGDYWLKLSPTDRKHEMDKYADRDKRDKDTDKIFDSDAFSLESVKKNDPELAKAIQALSKQDVKKSNLLFDGDKLHWRIGSKIIYSWRATSGKHDVGLPIKFIEQFRLDYYKIYKALQSSDSEDEKVRTIMGVFAPAKIERKKVDFMIKLFDRRKRLVKKFRDQPQDTTSSRRVFRAYKANGRRLGRIIYLHLADPAKYGTESFTIDGKVRSVREPEIRKALSKHKGIGPIPEGPYQIGFRLQDISNDGQVTFLDMLKLNVAMIRANEMPRADPESEAAIDFENDIIDMLDQSRIPSFEAPNRQPFTGEINSIYNRDWGRFRVRITNINKKARKAVEVGESYDLRSGFFIHGGDVDGSSGCIDLGDGMDSFAKFWILGGVGKLMGTTVKVSRRAFASGSWKEAKYVIPLTVKYTPQQKKKILKDTDLDDEVKKLIFSTILQSLPLVGDIGSGENN